MCNVADSSPVGGAHVTSLRDLCLTCLDRFGGLSSSASSSAELISDALSVTSDSESERARLALPFGLGVPPFFLCLRLSPLL